MRSWSDHHHHHHHHDDWDCHGSTSLEQGQWDAILPVGLDLAEQPIAVDVQNTHVLQGICGLNGIHHIPIQPILSECLLVSTHFNRRQQSANLVQGQILQGDGPIDLSKNKRMWSDDQRDVEHTREYKNGNRGWSEPGSVLVGLGLRLGLVTLERVGVWWRRCD